MAVTTKPPVIQNYLDYILADAVWSASVSPSTSYKVADFVRLLPAKRVAWAAKTVTITATLGSPKRADIFALPFSNLDAGGDVLIGGGVATLTNNSGLSQPLAIPASSRGGWPPTAWVDLSRSDLNGNSGWSVGQRTASVWNLVISGNSVNVIMGAALWLSGPIVTLARALDRAAKGGGGYGRTHPVELTTTYMRSIVTNEYGTDLVLDYRTRTRHLTGSYTAITVAEKTAFEDWIDGNHGGGRPGLFVRDTTVNDALLAYLTVSMVQMTMAPTVASYDLNLDELSKGQTLRDSPVGISPSASGSPSASHSPSASVSPSESPSASHSPSSSTSPSPSPSASPSQSPSGSQSPSASGSPSKSPSASVSPSGSHSPSGSQSPSASASPSASGSPSSSQSPSSSVSPS